MSNLILNLARDVDAFTKAYIECALWSSNDDNGQSLDANYNWTDLADETLNKIVADCAFFQARNRHYLSGYRHGCNVRGNEIKAI